MRVGILGGAFNPPHIGHLVCAQEALLQLELDRVVFIPVGEAPHRELEIDPGPETRLQMVELAIADDARFEASRIEIERDGPSYTADTLRALRDAEPGDELFLILGGDQAAALPKWHEPEQVLELAPGGGRRTHELVAQRGGHTGRAPRGRPADPLPRDADHPGFVQLDPPAGGGRPADPLPRA